jgi:hypothetical protein
MRTRQTAVLVVVVVVVVVVVEDIPLCLPN